jgi:hypothetical protein
MGAKLGILPQFAHRRCRQSRSTLVESAKKPPIRGTSLCRMPLFLAALLVFALENQSARHYTLAITLQFWNQCHDRRCRNPQV